MLRYFGERTQQSRYCCANSFLDSSFDNAGRDNGLDVDRGDKDDDEDS